MFHVLGLAGLLVMKSYHTSIQRDDGMTSKVHRLHGHPRVCTSCSSRRYLKSLQCSEKSTMVIEVSKDKT